MESKIFWLAGRNLSLLVTGFVFGDNLCSDDPDDDVLDNWDIFDNGDLWFCCNRRFGCKTCFWNGVDKLGLMHLDFIGLMDAVVTELNIFLTSTWPSSWLHDDTLVVFMKVWTRFRFGTSFFNEKTMSSITLSIENIPDDVIGLTEELNCLLLFAENIFWDGCENNTLELFLNDVGDVKS